VLKIRLLGQFDLSRNSEPVEVRSRSAQSLLAYLVLNIGIAHRREKLAGLLWPEATEANARSYLRKALWKARKFLAADTPGGEEYLLADDISIAFNPDAHYWLDADAVRSEPVEAMSVEDLIEAVSAYQGELLPGFYEEWVTLEREQLQAVFEHKLQVLLDRLVEEGRWAETVDWGERWIALGSMPEPAYRALMVAHAALGNIAKVAATYERCVQTLREGLAVDPSERTVALFQQLRNGAVIPTGDASATATVLQVAPSETTKSPPEASDRRLTNLPIPLTSFIGREDEVNEIKRLLADCRLLTLAGAGGSGKTRLAIRVAGEVGSMFSEGIWWIELGVLVEPQLVPQAVAKVLNVPEAPNQTLSETLTNALRSRQILLVLDCCEHLLDACAQLAEHLLKACSELKILVTSREVLGIAGERVFQVPTMSSPDPDRVKPSDFPAYDAVRLFVERAGTLKPDFALTDQNALAVGQLCHGLDGIPLAIELAAARVRALKVEQIAARLDDRFQLLTGGSRTALPRHQTLRATLDWSYDLLSDSERMMLQRLSVFTGGWSAAAAEAVCTGGEIQPDDVLDLLSQLSSKSLILSERKPGEQARYGMLETIREYTSEKLAEAGERAAVRDRHLDFFVSLAEEAEPQLFSPDQVYWLNRLEAEHENLRAAAAWSLERKAATPALRLVGALSWFWSTRGHYRETRELSAQILSSSFALERTAARAKALSISGLVQWVLGKEADVRPLLEEALDIAIEIGDRPNIAWSRVFLGTAISTYGDRQEGLSLIEEGLEECRALGSAGQYGVGFALSFLGDGAFYQGDYQRAQELYQKSVDVLSEVRDLNFLAYSLRRLGHTARYLGDLERAANGCQESLTLNLKIGHKQAVAACVSGLACVALAYGEAIIAAQLFAAVERQLERIGVSLLPSDTVEFERHIALVRDELGEAAFAAAWAEGRSMTIEQAITMASKQAARQV
jgi:predicted ATPase/DNA-binding SARP family transcriptional activator